MSYPPLAGRRWRICGHRKWNASELNAIHDRLIARSSGNEALASPRAGSGDEVGRSRSGGLVPSRGWPLCDCLRVSARLGGGLQGAVPDIEQRGGAEVLESLDQLRPEDDAAALLAPLDQSGR